MPYFKHEGHRLAYTEYGGPPKGAAAANGARDARRPLILLHGLLLSQEMHRPLAEALAARGNHVVTLDLLGHGRSDRPRDMWEYSMAIFGRQVLGLMDHLGFDEAAVMGTSLGANAALEVAAQSPERLRGMVIEMPVLDNGLLSSALTFTPLLVMLTFGEPVMKTVARAARAVPRGLLPHLGNVALDVVRQEPGPGGALMQGLFFGRVAPPRSERRKFEMRTLVLGHQRDPVHPFSDAGMLAGEMPNARLLEADSLLELRVRPDRLTAEIGDFLDELWSPRAKRRRPAAAAQRGAKKPTRRRSSAAAKRS
jgi:pimeloyl-ACP methyl ester carboxylesterase